MYKGVFSFLALFVCVNSVRSQVQFTAGNEESSLYHQVANVTLHTTEGDFELSTFYQHSPLLIAPIFSRCAGVCSPFLKNLAKALSAYEGKGTFRVLVVSFDPKDNVGSMQNLAKHYHLHNNKRWIFANTPSIDSLMASLGFVAKWDANRQQFEHDALLVGINENGYIARKLIGIRDAKSIYSVIDDVNNQFVLSYPLPQKNLLFSCFTYNPATGEKKFSFGLLVMLFPAIATVLLMVWFALRRPKSPIQPS